MATIGDLTRLLDRQTYSLDGRLAEDTVQSHVAGWMILAKPTLRAINHLPVGGRRENVNASFSAVLKPMITGPRKELPRDLRPAPRLVEIAQTMGAIADILSDTARFHPTSGLAGTDAIRLEATLLASIHVTARWSRSTLHEQALASTRQSLMAHLGDVAVLTEPWAMIPPADRVSALEHLQIPSASATGIEGAVVRWADEAKSVLQERYRPTGWAMQATAGTLALLSHLTREAVLRSMDSPRLSSGSAEILAETLAHSVRAWRAAATWPPNLRLGGSTEELRLATHELREECGGVRPTLSQLRHALGVALPVALLHASVMEGLVAGRELWIHGVIPGSQGDFARKWMRVPDWSIAGNALADAAREGYQAVDKAVDITTRPRTDGTAVPLGWPPTNHLGVGRPTQERDRGLGEALIRGLEIGTDR